MSGDHLRLPEVKTTGRAEAALAYAALGFAVLPLHAVRVDGGCTCGSESCPYPGKHPRGAFGHLLASRATREPKKIETWWQHFPNSNVGTPLGRHAGLCILDVDVPNGPETLSVYVANSGPLPPHVITRTPSGGFHYYYRYPAGVRRYESQVLGEGLEIRADTPGHSARRIAWAVLPPSRSLGGRYEWLERTF